MKKLFLWIGILSVAAVAEAGSGSLTIAPAVVTLSGEFGQTVTQDVTITNSTTYELAFDVVAEDVIVREGQRTFVPAGEVPGSIAATVVVSRRAVIVAPNTSEVVQVTFTLPPGTKNRAAAVIFQATRKVMNGSIPVLASIGSLFTFSVADEVVLDTRDIEITPQSATSNLRVSQHCVNRGADPAMTKGAAAIIDAGGALVGRINLESRRLLPGETADLAGEYAGELPPGRYRVLVTLDAGKATRTTTSELEVK